MLSINKTPLHKKSVFMFLAVSGLVLVLLAVAPTLFGSPKKSFGLVQLLLLRNGIVMLAAGLLTLLFPKVVSSINRIFDDSVYHSEREQSLAVRPLLSMSDFAILIVFLIAGNFFAAHIIGKENYIYFWDAANYFSKYAGMSELFKNSPQRAVLKTLTTIQTDHYNYLAPLLLTPFSLLFGITRMPYILALVNVFLFPASLVFLLVFKRTAGMLDDKRLPLGAVVLMVFTFFLFPFIWTPLLDGYVGIGGFIIIGMVLFTYFKYPFTAQRYGTLIVTGVLVSILVMFRQWYSFWAVSFFIALVLNECIFLFVEHRFERARLMALLKKLFMIMFASGFFYIMIAGPFLIKIISGDYSYLSLTYRFNDTVFQHGKRFLRHFGLFYVTLTVFGVLLSFYFRKTRKLASFLIIQWVAIFLMFTHVHSFLPHHYYLLQPAMLIFIALFIATVLLKVKSGTLKTVICSVYIAVSVIAFTSAFFPVTAEYTKPVKAWFPTQRYYPLVRNDMAEIKRLLNVLERILANPNDRLYVLASSSVLNSEMIKMAHLSLADAANLGKQVFRSSNLDLKDGFPSSLFTAKYVLVAEPVQYDFDPRQARVIDIPAESLLTGKNMGTSYKKLPYEFNLDKGIKAYIYKRVGPVNQTDIDFLSNELRKYYPDRPFVYQPKMK
jgi:hypothetical protein